MKVFYLLRRIGFESHSLWPPSPPPPELMPVEEAGFTSAYEHVWKAMRAMGYSDAEIFKLLAEWFAVIKSTTGLVGTPLWHAVSEKTALLYDAWELAQLREMAVSLGAWVWVAIIGYMIWNPVATESHVEFTPWDVYIITYGERGWYADLTTVSPKQKVFYRGCFELPRLISEHVWGGGGGFGEVDHFLFRPPIVEEGQEWFWYRRFEWHEYWVEFLGFLERVGANLYVLREPGVDRRAPPGSWIKPAEEWCMKMPPYIKAIL